MYCTDPHMYMVQDFEPSNFQALTRSTFELTKIQILGNITFSQLNRKDFKVHRTPFLNLQHLKSFKLTEGRNYKPYIARFQTSKL